MHCQSTYKVPSPCRLRRPRLRFRHGVRWRMVAQRMNLGSFKAYTAENDPNHLLRRQPHRNTRRGLALRPAHIPSLTEDRNRLRATLDAGYARLIQEVEKLSKDLTLAQSRSVRADQRCAELGAVL